MPAFWSLDCNGFGRKYIELFPIFQQTPCKSPEWENCGTVKVSLAYIRTFLDMTWYSLKNVVDLRFHEQWLRFIVNLSYHYSR